LKEKNFHLNTKFPAISLLVSGGHTQLYLLNNLTDIQLIGETRDDAAGECFDKIAKLLNLGYPGGPLIAKTADEFKNNNFKPFDLPRPLLHSKDYDFSFAGLKTAVLYLIEKLKKNKKYNKRAKQQICFESQNAICECLVSKTIKLAIAKNAKSIMISGGVSANKELRRKIQEEINNQKLQMDFYCPEFILSADNACMIAVAGYIKYLTNGVDDPVDLDINPNLKII